MRECVLKLVPAPPDGRVRPRKSRTLRPSTPLNRPGFSAAPPSTGTIRMPAPEACVVDQRRNGSALLRVEVDSDLVAVRADAGQARLSCRKRHETERDLAGTRR